MVLICSEAKRAESSIVTVDLTRDKTDTDIIQTQSAVVLLQLDDCKLKRLIKLCILKLNYFFKSVCYS